LIELLKYENYNDAWNGKYKVSHTKFEPIPTYTYRFGKLEGWKIYAG